MAKVKGRKRNLKTVKELAEQKVKAQKKPSKLKLFFRILFKPLVLAFKWLNQPAYIHRQHPEGSPAATLTKHRSVIPAYVKSSAYELKLTTWLDFPRAWRLTMAVFVFAIFFALLVTGLDWVLTRIFEEIILEKARNIKDLLN